MQSNIFNEKHDIATKASQSSFNKSLDASLSSDASQGYSADKLESGGLSQTILFIRNSKIAHFLMMLLLALLVEVVVFNHWAFSSMQGYQRLELSLINSAQDPLQTKYGRLVNVEKSKALVISNIKVKVKNLYLKLASSKKQMATVKVEFTDKASFYSFVPASEHKLSTRGKYSSSYFHFQQRDDYIYGLKIEVKSDLDSKQDPVYLQKLVFNEKEPIELSFLRLAILFLLQLFCYTLIANKNYQVLYHKGNIRHRVIELIPLALALLMSLLIFIVQKQGIGTFQAKEELLSTLSINKLWLAISSMVAIFLAFKAIISYLKIEVNLLLLSLSLAVMMFGSQVLYHQADLLKESISPIITILLMSLSLYAIYGYANKANAHKLSYGHVKNLGQEHIKSLEHANKQDQGQNQPQRSVKGHALAQNFKTDTISMILLGLFAFSALMLGLTRVLSLLLVLSLCSPLWWEAIRRVRSKPKEHKQANNSNELLLLSIILGVLLVSIAIKGFTSLDVMRYLVGLLGGEDVAAIVQQNNQLASLISIEMFANAMHYYFFEPLEYLKNFPMVLPSSTQSNSFGLELTIRERISVMAIPFAWISFMIFIKACKDKVGSSIALLSLVTMAIGVLYAYGSFYYYGAGAALSAPLLLAFLMMSSLIIIALFDKQQVKAQVYELKPSSTDTTLSTCILVIVSALALKSIVVSALIPFAYERDFLAGQFLRIANIDALLYLDYIFNSISF